MTFTVTYLDGGQREEIVCDTEDQAYQLAARLSFIEKHDYVVVNDDDIDPEIDEGDEGYWYL